jgi:hypothetical protein
MLKGARDGCWQRIANLKLAAGIGCDDRCDLESANVLLPHKRSLRGGERGVR